MNIFREVSKRITPYMKSKGFLLSGKSYYLVKNDIAFCIGFDTPSGLLYVTAYVMPLYVPCQMKYYTYGNRLNMIRDIQLPLLRKDDNSVAIDKWCSLLCEQISKKVLPYFEQVSTPESFMEFVKQSPQYSDAMFRCPEVYIARLQMYTCLYNSQFKEIDYVIGWYQQLLEESSFLTDGARAAFMDEIDKVRMQIQNGEGSAKEYSQQIIALTHNIISK